MYICIRDERPRLTSFCRAPCDSRSCISESSKIDMWERARAQWSDRVSWASCWKDLPAYMHTCIHACIHAYMHTCIGAAKHNYFDTTNSGLFLRVNVNGQ